jgi:hypothetical protein
MATRYVTNGARLLRAWLHETQTSIPVFAEVHGLDRIMVQRAINGERRRISVDLALAIELATKGAVPVAEWASATAIRHEDSRPDGKGSSST